MSSQIQSPLSREARYRVANAELIDLGVKLHGGEERSELKAELVDISQGGVRLRSDIHVPEQALLTITVRFKGVEEPLVVRGRVCNTRLSREGSFNLGCSIQPTIPQVILEFFAGLGMLERRQKNRQETSITVVARWELDQADLP